MENSTINNTTGDHKSLSKVIKDAFDVLSEETNSLYLHPEIKELYELPTALEFQRDYVGKNLPVIIRGATLQWPAVLKWNSMYFRTEIGEKNVTVAVTPNGYADGIAKKDDQEYFVMPEECNMTMNAFLKKLENLDNEKLVYYIQKQNSNFAKEFEELYMDVDWPTIDFMDIVFAKHPDAINLWMGDKRAITSMHKDPYENIYCVISGHKDFILIPPTDLPKVPRKKYPSAIYERDSKHNLFINPLFIDNNNKTPRITEWVSIDPLEPNLKQYPMYKHANTYEIRVNTGDILYLPSLWYHHVRQSHKCIALNFWYDMDFDSRYCFYKMMEKLCGYGDEIADN